MAAAGAFDVLVVDEAAQPIEAELLIAPFAFRPSRIVLVGDPRQLSSSVESRHAARAGLGRSMMSRLLEMGSGKSGAGFALLDTQYRMRPQISLWPSEQFYGGLLKNAPCVVASAASGTPPCPGGLRFLDCPAGQEQRRGGRSGGSLFNAAEAEMVVDVVCELCAPAVSSSSSSCASLSAARAFGPLAAAPPPQTVRVLTFYRAQVDLIRRRLRQRFRALASCSHADVTVDTVDSMQGSESDVVVLSFVRSGRRCGFLSDERRLNVALTRAKALLLLVGKAEALSDSSSEDVRSLMQSVVARGLVVYDWQRRCAGCINA